MVEIWKERRKEVNYPYFEKKVPGWGGTSYAVSRYSHMPKGGVKKQGELCLGGEDGEGENRFIANPSKNQRGSLKSEIEGRKRYHNRLVKGRERWKKNWGASSIIQQERRQTREKGGVLAATLVFARLKMDHAKNFLGGRQNL